MLMHALFWFAVALIMLKLAGWIIFVWWAVLIPLIIYLCLFVAFALFIKKEVEKEVTRLFK
jgi:hypothetical protein